MPSSGMWRMPSLTLFRVKRRVNLGWALLCLKFCWANLRVQFGKGGLSLQDMAVQVLLHLGSASVKPKRAIKLSGSILQS